jgi:hypothetical protein
MFCTDMSFMCFAELRNSLSHPAYRQIRQRVPATSPQRAKQSRKVREQTVDSGPALLNIVYDIRLGK